jgi:hypothetical protein
MARPDFVFLSIDEHLGGMGEWPDRSQEVHPRRQVRGASGASPSTGGKKSKPPLLLRSPAAHRQST